MKTKITFLAILFSILSFGQVGTIFTAGGIKYKITAPATVEVSENPESLGGAIGLPATVANNSSNYSVTSIGDYAFFNCNGITSVTIPDSVTSIGTGTFELCTGLTSVIIPNSITSIGTRAFKNSTGLTSVTISKSVTSISAFAFYQCAGLTSVTIPNSVIIIDSHAFSGCTGLTTITIPNSVTRISDSAFSFCSKLTSITIPNSVTIIDRLAFWQCNDLEAVTVNWTTPITIISDVFGINNRAAVTLNVPDGTETAYTTANVWNEFKIQATLSTNQFSVNTPIKFYPNPTQSQINFTQEINTLEVFDIAGKKVKSFQNPSASYDVSSLQKGVYILKGKTTDGKSVNEKLVKE